MCGEGSTNHCENTDKNNIFDTTAAGENTSGRGITDATSGKRSAKYRPLPAKKWGVGAYLALIPTLLCLVTLIVSADMNKLSFYGMSVLNRNLMLISIALVAISALLTAFRPRIPKALGWIVWALIPAGTMLLTEWIFRNPFRKGSLTWQLILFNILFYYIVAAFFLFITRNTFVSVICVTVFPLVLAVANHYVKLFRGTVLFPWDLQSIGTAVSVMDNYKFDFPTTMAFVIACFIVIWQLAYFSRVKFFRSIRKLIISIVCALLCLGMAIQYTAYTHTDEFVSEFKIYPYLFTPNAVYDNNGVMVSLLYSLQFMDVETPEGYSTDKVSELVSEYGSTGADVGTDGEQPNIIVIMNEAWSDISVLAPFTTDNEVFPVTVTLDDNTIRGEMYMSVLGGNTANSEFEFLTSSTMAFLPPGCVAYQQFIKHRTPTLVASLEAQGYQSIGMHPYYAKGWDRNKVYPFFGFDKTYFLEDLPSDTEKVRDYVSDSAMFKKITEYYEERDADRPFFLFGVTMQNHGGYTGTYDNFTEDVHIEGLESNKLLSQYLSLIRRTDIAFGELLDYFSNVEEPTVILMFGDHQPGTFVTNALYANAGMTLPADSASRNYAEYRVPFIMWANYDIEEQKDVVTSPNYLSVLLCETAGVRLTPYQEFVRDLREDYPVVTANFYMDAEGNYYPNNEMANVPEFNDYRILQYNQIIDWKNRVEMAFTISSAD